MVTRSTFPTPAHSLKIQWAASWTATRQSSLEVSVLIAVGGRRPRLDGGGELLAEFLERVDTFAAGFSQAAGLFIDQVHLLPRQGDSPAQVVGVGGGIHGWTARRLVYLGLGSKTFVLHTRTLR